MSEGGKKKFKCDDAQDDLLSYLPFQALPSYLPTYLPTYQLITIYLSIFCDLKFFVRAFGLSFDYFQLLFMGGGLSLIPLIFKPLVII
jgi:hypothetical protein